jgi:hypothetical protein
VLRRALEGACLAFIEVLDGYTLSVVKPKTSLQALLSMTPIEDKRASARTS